MDLEKVRKIWKMIQGIADNGDYREFEVAFLIDEMLNNVVTNENDITQDLVDKVCKVGEYKDTLLNDEVYGDLANIERELLGEEE